MYKKRKTKHKGELKCRYKKRGFTRYHATYLVNKSFGKPSKKRFLWSDNEFYIQTWRVSPYDISLCQRISNYSVELTKFTLAIDYPDNRFASKHLKYVKDNYYKIVITTMIKQYIRKKLNDNITTIF